MGTALVNRVQRQGLIGVSLVTRTDNRTELDAPVGDPILVCTREDDLQEVIDSTPEHRRSDLVFVQNGMLDDFLAEQGLGDNTRGLLFFAVPARGDDLQPGPPSPFTGPHAETVVRVLTQLDVPAVEVARGDFSAQMLEKLIWNCAFGLLCQVHGATVGEVCTRHLSTLRIVVEELLTVGTHALDIEVDYEPLLERLCAYSRSIADYRGAVKAWTWRNGWFVEAAARMSVPTPAHLRLLREVGQGGQY